jgi:hypothetical protein
MSCENNTCLSVIVLPVQRTDRLAQPDVLKRASVIIDAFYEALRMCRVTRKRYRFTDQ